MPDKKPAKEGHVVDKVFSTIGEKTGVNKKKVDDWRAKWLAMPKNRTKYESIKNAPDVVGEEVFAMTNDIIDFCQGEHGGQSHVFNKLKDGMGGFLKNPAGYLKDKAEEGKKKAMEAKKMAEKKAAEAKKAATKKTKK